MVADPLPYVAPVFAVALAAEHWLGGRYARRTLVSAIGCAALDQLAAVVGLAVFAAAFAAVHRLAPIELSPRAPLTWAIAVVAHDLAYYAYHRASHRVNVLWAAHVVHHQSASYDLTVSLRQGALATWVTYAFYLPLALVVDVRVFLVVHAAYQVFQFFVHTRWVRRLGPLEWILATPSHHRVHHGCDRAHLDRNYGGFFIVFDRLLGTFTPEDREPRYGVPGGYEIVSPLFANTYLLARLAACSRAARARGQLWRLWFGPPEASAHLVSSAGHASRIVDDTPARRTWLPLAAGCAGTAAIVFARGSLPGVVVALVALASVVLFEVASAPLDGR